MASESVAVGWSDQWDGSGDWVVYTPWACTSVMRSASRRDSLNNEALSASVVASAVGTIKKPWRESLRKK